MRIGARTGRRPVVVCDNTLLGPFAQRPIALGVDLCMTSLTKYCGGHSDLLAGGVSGKLDLIAPLRLLRTTLGSHCDPFTSWLVLRSMESVHVRSERAMHNARVIATFLRDHPKVAGITYLGFLPEGSPQRAVFDRQLRRNVVFADHSLATDTVFSEVHLVSCRNVLIYFNRDLQDRAVGLFREALVHRGFLGLGSKESLQFGQHHDAFEVCSREHRLYRKVA